MMISSIQSLLQKHYKWLFSVLLAIIIVSFVFTIGASPGLGTKGKKRPARPFYGQDLGNERVVDHLVQAAYLSALLKFDATVYNPSGLEYATLSRAALLSMSSDLQIPMPNESQLKTYIKACPLFLNPKGIFDEKLYTDFVTSVQKNPSLQEETVYKVLSEDLMNQRIKSVLSCGFVFPTEARLHFSQKQAIWDIEVGFMNFNTYNPSIVPTEKELKLFYEEQKSNYKASAQATASYAVFPANAFLGKVAAPQEAELKEFYNQHKDQWKDKSTGTQSSFENARGAVKAAYAKQKAQLLAEKAANDFCYQLYNQKIAYESQVFGELLKAQGGELRKLPSYSADAIPASITLPHPFLLQVFNLNASKYYTDVERVAEGAAIIFLEKQTPERLLSFEQAKEKLTEHYKGTVKARRFIAHGELVKKEITSSLKQKAFKEIVESKGLTYKSYNNLKLKDAPKEITPAVIEALVDLQVKQVSDMVPVNDGGVFVYLSQKKLPVSTPKDLKETTNELKPYMDLMVERSILSECIEKELQKTQPKP